MIWLYDGDYCIFDAVLLAHFLRIPSTSRTNWLIGRDRQRRPFLCLPPRLTALGRTPRPSPTRHGRSRLHREPDPPVCVTILVPRYALPPPHVRRDVKFRNRAEQPFGVSKILCGFTRRGNNRSPTQLGAYDAH